MTDISAIIAKAADGQPLDDAERAALKAWKAPDTKALEDANAQLRAQLALATGAKDKGAAEMETLWLARGPRAQLDASLSAFLSPTL